MNSFRVLRTSSLAEIDTIQHPEDKEHLSLDSPALEVFTDFEQHMPLMLEETASVDEAIETMRRTHVKLKLIIDSREAFRGVITLADLMSVKVMQAAESTGLSRSELSVAQVMTPRSDLHAICVEDLTTAKIGDILATMKTFGDQHVLVLDRARRSIRGIISARDIARALHIPVSIDAKANSFSEVYHAIRG